MHVIAVLAQDHDATIKSRQVRRRQRHPDVLLAFRDELQHQDALLICLPQRPIWLQERRGHALRREVVFSQKYRPDRVCSRAEWICFQRLQYIYG